MLWVIALRPEGFGDLLEDRDNLEDLGFLFQRPGADEPIQGMTDDFG